MWPRWAPVARACQVPGSKRAWEPAPLRGGDSLGIHWFLQGPPRAQRSRRPGDAAGQHQPPSWWAAPGSLPPPLRLGSVVAQARDEDTRRAAGRGFPDSGEGTCSDRQAVYRGADAGPSAPSPALGDRVALQPRSGRRAGDSRPRSGTRASRRASLSGAPRRGAGAVLESFTSPARGRRPSPPPRTRAQRDPGCADVRLRLNLGRRRCGLV